MSEAEDEDSPLVPVIVIGAIVALLAFGLIRIGRKNGWFNPCLDAFNRNSPLHKAAFAGDAVKVRALLDANPDAVNITNRTGATPLHSAFFFAGGLDDWARNLARVETVGSDSKGRYIDALRGSDKMFERALKKFEVAQLLMDKGADITAKDAFQKTPIESAPDHFMLARAGLLEPMKKVLQLKGADPLATSPNGTTLLHSAAFCGGDWKRSNLLSPKAIEGKKAIAAYLMALGLNPASTNQDGRTAFDNCAVIGPELYPARAGPGAIYIEMGECLYARPAAVTSAHTVTITKESIETKCGITFGVHAGMVFVIVVKAGGLAAGAGLAQGDQLTRIMGEPPPISGAATSQVLKAARGEVTFEVVRRGATTVVTAEAVP